MRHRLLNAIFAGSLSACCDDRYTQETQENAPAGQYAGGERSTSEEQGTPGFNGTPEQRAAATRVFLGLGPEPDKAAAARGAPLFQQKLRLLPRTAGTWRGRPKPDHLRRCSGRRSRRAPGAVS